RRVLFRSQGALTTHIEGQTYNAARCWRYPPGRLQQLHVQWQPGRIQIDGVPAIGTDVWHQRIPIACYADTDPAAHPGTLGTRSMYQDEALANRRSDKKSAAMCCDAASRTKIETAIRVSPAVTHIGVTVTTFPGGVGAGAAVAVLGSARRYAVAQRTQLAHRTVDPKLSLSAPGRVAKLAA